MDITFLRPQGPQPTEFDGLAELRRGLPGRWKGYANFIMRQPGRRGQDREIDVVLITDDRLVLIDLKHWSGRIENREGFWFRNDERQEPSSAHKIREHAKVLASLIRKEVLQLQTVPPVESVVVFTNPNVNITGLEKSELERSLKLADFLVIADERRFATLFTTHSSYGSGDALCGKHFSAFRKLFTNGKLFEPRNAKFQGFIPTGVPELEHGKLFVEFACRSASDPNYTGLLRLWDFGEAGDAFCVEETRRPLAERERAVLGYLRMQDPLFHDQFVLRSLAHDDEYTLRYYEIFDRHPDLRRFVRFEGALSELEGERRTELAQFLLDRVASLHRLQVAHRDIDRHSVWIDDHRSRVVLSGFGAARFPERRTIGEDRAKLLVAGHRTPEDVGVGRAGSAFQQDVFLAAVLTWTTLTGEMVPVIDDVPLWTPSLVRSDHGLAQGVVEWFERCLALDAPDRYADGIEAAESFNRAVAKSRSLSLEGQLARYRRDIDPLSDFAPVAWIRKKPYRVYRSTTVEDDVFVKSWPGSYVGDVRKAAAHLVEFFARVDKVRALGIVGWTPRIRDAALCTDGLILIQDWVEGMSLDNCGSRDWGHAEYRPFLLALVAAIEGLHGAGLAHGDLSPNNILVRATAEGPRPILVDLIDYAPTGVGELKTLAYCPPNEAGSDLQLRDRYAVCAVTKELLGRSDAGEAVGRWIEAAEACGEGELPWRSLRPLRDALTEERARSADLSASRLSIGLPSPPFEGDLLSDDGSFHLIANIKRRRLEIVGFDQKVTIDIDAQTTTPSSARLQKVDARGSSWAMSHRVLSFSGVVNVYRSPRPQFGGFTELLGLPELERIFSPDMIVGETAPIADNAVELADADDNAQQDQPPEAPPPSSERFSVVRFWDETIRVEEEIRPEVQVTEPPKPSTEPGTLIVTCEQGRGDLDLSAGQSVSVTWNGTKIGDLDVGRSRGDEIVIRNARRYRGIGAGDTLKVQSSDDWISFERRSKAVRRILQKRSQIPNLIEYFDPGARLTPQVLAEPIPEGALRDYELNPEQEEAFRHLWVHGPLGLLQGPPGTGKTRFIAAFAHYALTKGRLRNLLVLSQSHEAVNTAAEGVLAVSQRLGGDVDLLRVGQHSKISAPLREFHSQAVQDRYRELFRAEVKERLIVPARHLGLRPEYVRSAVETEAGVGAIVRQIMRCQQDIDLGDDADAVRTAEDRLPTLEAALEQRLTEEPFAYGLPPIDALSALRDQVARAHGVIDPDARRRLLTLNDLARDWVAVLGIRHRNLEEFLARSRNLVCGTCVGIGRQGIRVDRSVFDLVIIDEAARCTPGELAVGMQSGRRVLLVGDHRQLPPLFDHDLIRAVMHRVGGGSRQTFEHSDFERAFSSQYGGAIARTLKRQYRMAPKIAALVHDTFYASEELTTGRSGPSEIYATLEPPLDDEVTWIDTGFPRSSVPVEARVGTSYTNRREVNAVVELVRRLSRSRRFLDAVIPTLKDGEPLVGIICTYASQARLVRETLLSSDVADDVRSLVKVDTVDSYQGKENRIVILTLVRSNPERTMGFVNNANRTNVALSRAMERLVIVGSAEMYREKGNPLAPVVKKLGDQGRILRDVDVLGG